MNKESYPKPIRSFLDHKEVYEKKAPLVIGEYLKLDYFDVSDDSRVPQYTDEGNIEYGGKNIADCVALSKDEREEFKNNFVSLIQHDMEDSMSRIVFGVLLNEEDEGFPVYYFGDLTEGKLTKISDRLEYFVAQYFEDNKKGNDPQKALESTLESIQQKSKAKEYPAVITEVDDFLMTYADFIKNINIFDLDSKHMVGALYNFKGLAFKASEKWNEAVKAFEKAELFGDDMGLLNLIDSYCYDLKEYEKARKLSRKYVTGDYAWFHAVKVDAYASVMLNDGKEAEKCYRMLEKEFLHKDDEKINQARCELEEADTPLAKEILKWFGIVDEGIQEDTQDLRKWWKSLNEGWQNQFKLFLIEESGHEARQKVLEKIKEPTDDQLRFIVSRDSIRMDYYLCSDSISSLQPLQKLKKLKRLNLNYWDKSEHWETFLSDLTSLIQLEELQMEGNKLVLKDLNFLRPLTRLKDLNLNDNLVYDLSALCDLKKLKKLSLRPVKLGIKQPYEQVKVFKDLSPIGQLTGLEELFFQAMPHAEFPFLKNLIHLKRLHVYGCGISHVSGIKGCERLEFLTISSCHFLEDVTELGELKHLTNLTLSMCQKIQDHSFLGSLISLNDLKLEHQTITDLSVLKNVKNLKYLSLQNLPVKAIEPLCALSALEGLSLWGDMAIEDFEALTSIRSLKKITIYKGRSMNKPVKKEQVKAFQKKRPEVEINIR